MSRAQTCRLHQIPPDVQEAFDIQGVLTESACRAVYTAMHRTFGVTVIIKVLRPFDHTTLAIRALNEVKLLRHFKHPNIISILDIVKPRDYDSFTELYIVQELMETNLRKVIETREVYDGHCQYFIWQILCALHAMHSAGVLHRDLTPSNVLFNRDCSLKVGDLSLARSAARVKAEQGSTREYVTSLRYRAPEVFVAFAQYTYAVDIWSLGCIFAEILTGKPLFPGNDNSQQLALIFDVLGTPLEEDTRWIISEPARARLRRLPFEDKVPWEDVFPKASPDALDLVARLLTFDPTKRISAKEALRHPYLRAYHDCNIEPAGAPIPDELFDFDKVESVLNKQQLKGEVAASYSSLRYLRELHVQGSARDNDGFDRQSSVSVDGSVTGFKPLREYSSDGYLDLSISKIDSCLATFKDRIFIMHPFLDLTDLCKMRDAFIARYITQSQYPPATGVDHQVDRRWTTHTSNDPFTTSHELLSDDAMMFLVLTLGVHNIDASMRHCEQQSANIHKQATTKDTSCLVWCTSGDPLRSCQASTVSTL